MNKRPQFPPVGLLSDWGPVDAPQFLPAAPHNLPANRDRPPLREFQSGVTSIVNVIPGDIPSGGPLSQPADTQTIYDPHHYVYPIEGNFLPTVNSQRFLEQGSNKRNWLMLRNGGAAASVRISFGIDAGPFSTLVLAPGDVILLDVGVPQGDVYCQLSAADATASLLYSFSTIAG